ncbi:hypothetical protein CDAR_233521 [Caerostris darwini]|uniref:Uncharacterized protein n=1 Tax=Caerostris darwini TaxID=1538125 RepID=A0AAV4NFT7_9ARAC|nr:hypothetical protein CDAR_233521 [Caerostris darwini]
MVSKQWYLFIKSGDDDGSFPLRTLFFFYLYIPSLSSSLPLFEEETFFCPIPLLRRNSNVRKEQTIHSRQEEEANSTRLVALWWSTSKGQRPYVWLVGWTQITISQKQAQNNATLLRVCSPVKSEAHGDSLVAKW